MVSQRKCEAGRGDRGFEKGGRNLDVSVANRALSVLRGAASPAKLPRDSGFGGTLSASQPSQNTDFGLRGQSSTLPALERELEAGNQRQN